MELLRAVLHGGQPFGLGFVGEEIVVERAFEACQNILSRHVAARDELAVVEAHAIVEEHLDVAHDQRAAVAVDGVLQLVADVV